MKDKYQAVLRWMDGNKTYLGAIGYGLLGISWGQNWISDDYAKVIAGLLTAWTGFAIKSAIKKAEAKAEMSAAIVGGIESATFKPPYGVQQYVQEAMSQVADTKREAVVEIIGKAHADETMAKWEEAAK